ncbi:receptor-like protein kinase-like [Tripterygium wilfordii]|uniref:non-specific serine/threonine protein kinase n=1 Tax=Tripterygium wilfordii TaxID=458696 RepID=A0A7J7DSD6_TRIWF|nr:receptor-like protein kinase-like [Tripterygium wilfordii]
MSTNALFLFFFFLVCPFVSSQLAPNQRTTMINLSESLANSSNSSIWNVTKQPDPCSWKGVGCDPTNSSITQLSLSGFGLSTPDFLSVACQLDSLESLDVSNNHLSSISDEIFTICGGIDGLKVLNICKNSLSHSLPAFPGFLGLEVLDLSYNKLGGSIESQLDGLSGLKRLNLSFNNFSGAIPIGKSMHSLEHLVLNMNSFQGTITKEIANYKNLSRIDFTMNQLSGSLPVEIGELSKLELLILSSNNFSGEIPTTLSNIQNLSRFAANQNGFGGSVPAGLTRYLKNLDLSYNRLNGSLPSDLLSQTNLEVVDLSYNMLEGSIPANISQRLFRLRLGSNALTGRFEGSAFTMLQNLTYLELDNNSFTGSIPPQLGFCRRLLLLNLAKNNLTGALPAQLGNLSNLQVMKLEQNNLTGEIPTQITQLLSLLILNISWNSLTGSIPSSVSQLRALNSLNLQANHLNGSIPDTIVNMDSLMELQLGSNQLSGRIPTMPRTLQIALNLSSNLFNGSIPDTLSALTALEVLDLSNNRFTGEIPTVLTQLISLTQLTLSNNKLSGVVPKFQQHVALNISGNPDLINNTASPPATSAKKKNTVVVPIIAAFAAGVVVVVIVTFIVLSILRRYYKVDDEQVHTGEELSLPQVIQGKLLTANGIHRSNIDFAKAMEAVADPLNVKLKTRFATYYKAIMPSGTRYTVKKINWSDKIFQLGSHDRFRQELEVLGKLSMSNVMIPLAYVLTEDGVYLFYEYAQKGTLFDILHGSMGNALDWTSRYSIAVGVAQGLAFLHEYSSGPILLLDLSSKNIMLKSVMEPQIGDIELCKIIDPSKSTGSLSTVAGSVGYIPPGT